MKARKERAESGQCMELSKLREQIDRVDREMLRLFYERQELTREVAEAKVAARLQVRDLKREKEKLAELTKDAPDRMTEEGIREMFSQLMAVSRKKQYQLMSRAGFSERLPFERVASLGPEAPRVIYQGVEGAYSHMAALQFFGEEAFLAPVETWDEAMNALCAGRGDYAVMPIENSSAGTVGNVFDLLMKYDNYIVGETVLPVEHALLGVPGADIAQIWRVISHPQALAQCAKYLAEHRGWEQEQALNTAAAARRVAEEKDPSQAAIASRLAGQLYGLEVLKAPVNHDLGNVTRFVILSNRKIFVKTARRITVCFECPHETGALYRLLSHFIYNDINLTRIESRPIPGETWEYRFFVDLDGNLVEPGVKNALKGLSEEALSLKILGNY